MIELPESIILSKQLEEVLVGLRVKEVIANASPHKFAWLSGDSKYYEELLIHKYVTSTRSRAGNVEIMVEDATLMFAEGIKFTYLLSNQEIAKKHQLLIRFDDGSCLLASVQMYGGMWCFVGDFNEDYFAQSLDRLTPDQEAFNEKYFLSIINEDGLKKKSLKEVLATKQRIPGLGNGVLQDILYNAKLHHKRKVFSLTDDEKHQLFLAIKDTLDEMTNLGGRDTEKDLFGCPGDYSTKMSKYTVGKPCTLCGSIIQKKSYMGGSIYYCEQCQKE